ncbi:MAG: hypothetical protein A3J07_03485 [Candidatus Doudnabacteria bacterium RIFCSPLOWO2_02_FULL_49_13]|uniref:Uncharacterized protein n=1 Tax=Candidatus Doudnabacteria bacterium RIFCSPHIGHO2_12_FULL_48_16 TaxID=1817838 RepID=A0A1F5PJ64_9BACT|nr:MAG: hypothetical protein A3B77_02290 [Candidatus Doudnabacteria bacterium RIFCSPHIGHO2_02_FULL_49_24]OGE89885.1 MAG: hypothetical protein A2760_03995 [Candidatus Doudnabacteria bacterium RIFCSPHIGHO2_01_FULL_50_67]OGE89985.1 MAG: hypothetical protein A3E29_02630 [Candidatus Doudnabacteria bacterium RIFCSPHIGHO2_12_FULL_48_16]OGE97470.1 MAG: hypothetical protein A2990_02005 [Candidatus Doudnabacteria bacterium RIFCSPLOWO2_01_FULL_49_40]OGF03126.1 MAG: hypothetical protein A3J07_03485 [Candid
MSELGREFAARRSRMFRDEEHEKYTNLADEKMLVLEEAMKSDDLELIDKKLSEYKAFIHENKDTNAS